MFQNHQTTKWVYVSKQQSESMFPFVSIELISMQL